MAFEQPLNFDYWFINVFAGRQDIFIFILLIFFSALAAKFRMPKGVMLMLLFLFVIIAMAIDSAISGTASGIFILLCIVAPIGIYYIVSRITK